MTRAETMQAQRKFGSLQQTAAQEVEALRVRHQEAEARGEKDPALAARMAYMRRLEEYGAMGVALAAALLPLLPPDAQPTAEQRAAIQQLGTY